MSIVTGTCNGGCKRLLVASHTYTVNRSLRLNLTMWRTFLVRLFSLDTTSVSSSSSPFLHQDTRANGRPATNINVNLSYFLLGKIYFPIDTIRNNNTLLPSVKRGVLFYFCCQSMPRKRAAFLSEFRYGEVDWLKTSLRRPVLVNDRILLD